MKLGRYELRGGELFVRWGKAGDTGWHRIGFSWRPNWGTESWWAVRGLVLQSGLRLGPVGFYWMTLLPKAEIERGQFQPSKSCPDIPGHETHTPPCGAWQQYGMTLKSVQP